MKRLASKKSCSPGEHSKVWRAPMMMRLLLAAALACACSQHAQAHHFRFTANLTGPAESPPNDSTGFGHAVITLDVDEGVMEIQTSFNGLMGIVTAAHIH